MTRKRKIEDKISTDNSSTVVRQRKSSESLAQDTTQLDNSKQVEDASNKTATINNPEQSVTKNVNNDKTIITNISIPLIDRAVNDQPIRKSHRISKLRKAIKTTVLNSNASPLSPSLNAASSSKNQPANSLSNNIVTTSANNSTQQSQTQNNAQQCNNNSTTQGPSSIPSKPIRKILVWSENDTRWFFEALCEHGKDFHHIQGYIASRYEKKGISADLIKNYENVRHYYYRMWHKVSQMLKLPYEIEKNVLETYGLINYGELWKRVGSKLDVKLIGNLQQLVLYGFTAFKVKGKMYRVRTPICNALKRIHNIQVPKPPSYQIPKEITVEIVPETNRDWIHVQKLSQNPRLRTKLTMQHRLSSLIEYLEKRWNKENLLERAMQHLFTEPGEDVPQIGPSFSIRVRPKNADKICTEVYLKATGSVVGNLRTLPSSNSNLDLSLSSFLNKQKLKKANDSAKVNKNLGKDKDKEDKSESLEDKNSNDSKDKKDKPFTKSNLNDDKSNDKKEDSNSNEEINNSDKKNSENKVKDDSERPSIRMFQLLDELNEKCNEDNSETIEDEDVIIEEGRLFDLEPNDLFEAVSLLEPPENMTLVQWLDSEGQEEIAVPEEEKEEEEKEEEDKEGEEKEEEPTTATQATKNAPEVGKSGRKRTVSTVAQDVELCNLEAAKRGWTKEEADSISICELFLLVGCPEKILLEYSWIELENSSDNNTFITDEEKKDLDLDEEIFDKLAFCANALLSSFKKPASFQNFENKAAASTKTKNTKEIKRKEPKKPITKTVEKPETSSSKPIEPSNTKDNPKDNLKNASKSQKSVEIVDESKKKAPKMPKRVQELPECAPVSSKTTSERLPSSGVRVQAVSEEKVKEALADLYNNSHGLFRRSNLSVLKSPLKPITPRKDKSLEFVVELGPSFVQNSGQGTFQIQQSNIQPITSKSPTPLIPVKFVPAVNVTSHQSQHQHSYQPFSQHQTSHSGQAEQTQLFQHTSNSEFRTTFMQQTVTTSQTVRQHPPQTSISATASHPQNSSSTWLNELHNESSMGSLLAACDLMSQEMAYNKPRDKMPGYKHVTMAISTDNIQIIKVETALIHNKLPGHVTCIFCTTLEPDTQAN